MCQICSTFNPQLLNCSYEGLPTATAEGAMFVPGDTISETGDASSNTGTAAGISSGEYFSGSLSSGTDTDWIAVTLEAGTTYTIAATGVGPLSTAVNDTTLRLRDENGQQIEFDDDGGPGFSSLMTVTISETATYYVEVASYSSFDSGTYGMSVTEGTRASYNDDMGAGNLMRPNQAWVTTPGTEVDVTWAFRASGNDPSNNSPLIAMNANQTALTIAAMAYVDAISGLNFTQVAPGTTSNNATILFGAYNFSDGAGAYAYYPGSNGGNTSFGAVQGDIWLNNQSFYNGQSYGFGTYTNYTMLHEIGHAIGLAHPGQYNAGTGGAITYNNSAQFIEDSMQYTVMSYFDETNTGVSGGLSYPDTFMLHDYMAIHQLYGADVTYNAGNTIYGFNSTEGGTVYDFTANTTPFMTVYDGQGIDQIDLSGYAMDQWLSLEEGVFSNIGGYTANFSIAYGAVIENATGGSGADTITGNSANNVLDGGDGKDSLYGGQGDDTLNGDGQWDLIEGGDGNDSLSGGTGNDTIHGGNDNDFLFGGQGNDFMTGGTGRDRLTGAKGDDTIDGGNFHDKLIGNEGDDVLRGANGDDTMRGGTGDDYLEGGRGEDSLFGGADFDTLDGGEGNDTLTGNFNADQFIFNDDHGVDIITDFAATNDFEKIDVSGLSTINSMDDLFGDGIDPGVASQQGNDVLIDTGGGNSILLQNVLYSDLDALDFVF